MALGFLLVVVGMLFLATGLIGELLMRIYFEATAARTYGVRRIVRKDQARPCRRRAAEKASSLGM